MPGAAATESDAGLPLNRAAHGGAALLLAIGLLAGANGCTGKIATLRAEAGGVAVTAEVQRIRKRDEGAFVFVDLEIRGNGKTLVSADLDCFVLHVGSITSSATYPDSIASVNTNDFPARDGVVSAAAYWHFAQVTTLRDESLREASIEIREKKDGSCFQFR